MCQEAVSLAAGATAGWATGSSQPIGRSQVQAAPEKACDASSAKTRLRNATGDKLSQARTYLVLRKVIPSLLSFAKQN